MRLWLSPRTPHSNFFRLSTLPHFYFQPSLRHLARKINNKRKRRASPALGTWGRLLRKEMEGEEMPEAYVMRMVAEPDLLSLEENGIAGDREVDFDYEFDAAGFFDFSRPESDYEARTAERWFQSAPSYPPSPFVGILKDIGAIVISEETNTMLETKDLECKDMKAAASESPKGDLMSAFTSQDAGNNVNKTIAKGPFTRCSTLMKPTASHLAKQHQPREIKSGPRSNNRFIKPLANINKKSCANLNDNGSQPTKRQKIEGGHLSRVVGVTLTMELVHKLPQKKSEPCNPKLPRLNITIPREPNLQTAQRAQNRSKNVKDLEEPAAPTTRVFKARPLNKKNPTCAVQKVLGDSARLHHQNVCKSQMRNDEEKLEKCGNMSLHFKARPLDQKILSSKGDIGIFRSIKRGVTRAREFNLSSSRRRDDVPPLELFSKLSLNSGTQTASLSEANLLQTLHVTSKGSKENVIAHVGQENIEELQRHRGNWILTENSATNYGVKCTSKHMPITSLTAG